MFLGLSALSLCLLFACVEGPGGTEELVLPSYEYFVRDLQPELATACSNPSCHGVQRPLELYAAKLHRKDPSRVHFDEPLTEDELRLNHLRTATFLVGVNHPADSALLTKPLAPEAGGSEHTGGVQYSDIGEPGYRALLRWACLADAFKEECGE